MRVKAIVAAAFLIVAGFSLSAHAAWPERPLRFIVPYAAGGMNDISARITAQWLSKALKQGVIVENRTGANGAIAAEFVARAPADGYTFLMTTSAALVIVPHLQKVNYDPLKSFAPVSIIDASYVAIALNPTFPANNLSELVAYAKQQPNNLNFATGAIGSTGHLTMTLFFKQAGITMTPVPYRGSSAAILAVLGGQVPVAVGTVSDIIQYHKSGKLKIVGVSSAKRSSELPDVPTIAEQGYPGFTTTFWDGLLAPAGTPKSVIATLTDALKAACNDAEFTAKYQAHSAEAMCTTPEQFSERMQTDLLMWGEAAKASGMTPQ